MWQHIGKLNRKLKGKNRILMEVPKATICMRLKLLLQYTEKPKTMIQLFNFGLYSLFLPDIRCRK